MNKILSKIFARKELVNDPPVLIDIGASEGLHRKWKKFARYSICVAFDADERDFRFVEKEKSSFKKLYIFNCIVTDKNENQSLFYLTKSPYCSSTLKPNYSTLNHYIFSPLFEVEKTVKLNNISLLNAISQLKIKKIDWLKSDSQGIDLRLIKGLDDKMRRRIIVVELEPGVIDAYVSEDKMHSILSYMNNTDFWLSDIVIKGVARLPYKLFTSYFRENLKGKLIKESMKKAPCWGEMTFFNSFLGEENFSIREYLLGWTFATIENHHSFALYIAERGRTIFNDEIFIDLVSYSVKQIKYNIIKLKFLPSFLSSISKKLKFS